MGVRFCCVTDKQRQIERLRTHALNLGGGLGTDSGKKKKFVRIGTNKNHMLPAWCNRERSLPPPGVLFFLLAVLLAVCRELHWRACRWLGKGHPDGFPGAALPREEAVAAGAIRITLLIAAPETGSFLMWQRQVLSHVLSQAADPAGLQMRVLLPATEALLTHGKAPLLDTHLRNRVRLEMSTSRTSASAHGTVRRLVRRFVQGDEQCVAVLHAEARFLPGWDLRLLQLLETNPHALLSCPTASSDSNASGAERARFPTLRVRSTGAAARDSSKPFADHAGSWLIPSVCLCPELVAFCPEACPEAWTALRAKRPKHTPVEPRPCPQEPWLHHVPSVPLLAHDDALEDRILDEDQGLDQRPVSGLEAAGLHPFSNDAEKITKFGSAMLAQIAVQRATRDKLTH